MNPYNFREAVLGWKNEEIREACSLLQLTLPYLTDLTGDVGLASPSQDFIPVPKHQAFLELVLNVLGDYNSGVFFAVIFLDDVVY